MSHNVLIFLPRFLSARMRERANTAVYIRYTVFVRVGVCASRRCHRRRRRRRRPCVTDDDVGGGVVLTRQSIYAR